MTRPTAAFVGMGLSNPIRLVMNRGLHATVAKLLSVDEARALKTDLTVALLKAKAAEGKKNGTRPAADNDLEHPGGAG